MKLHKSFGLWTILLIVPRLVIRRGSVGRLPAAVKGPEWEQWLATLNHYLLYGMVSILSFTGLGMGYASGKGIPFFSFGTIWGSNKPIPSVAKPMFKVHKFTGTYLPWAFFLHLGGTAKHQFIDKSNIIRRII